MDMKRQVLLFSVAAMTVAFAAPFAPVAEGDLAAGATWGTANPPGADDSVTINRSGTYTASADLSIQAITVTAANVTFDFRATPSRKIELLSTKEHLFERATASDSTNTFMGGLWTCPNNTGEAAFFVAASGKHRQVVSLTDGCVVSNVNRALIYYSTGTRLTLSGGSRIHAKEFMTSYRTGSGSMVEVTDGSSIVCSHGFFLDNGTTGAAEYGRSQVYVSGLGSSIVSKGNTSYVSQLYPGCSLTVANGATANFSYLMVGGDGPFATDGLLAVTNGASVTVNNTLTVRGAGDTVLVDDASISFNTLSLGHRGTFCMRGSEVSVSGIVEKGNAYDFFVTGTTNALFSIEDGAVFNNTTLSRFLQLAYGCTGCVTRVTGAGSKLAVYDGGETLTYGLEGQSNRLEVLEGGTLDIGQLRISGRGNVLVVSNATVRCTKDNGIWEAGFVKSGKTMPTNALIVLRGAAPRFETPNTLSMNHGARLRWEIPREGYASGHVPVSAKSLDGSGVGGGIEIECREFSERTGGRLVLAQVTSVSKSLSSWVAAAVPTLPAACTLAIEGTELVLSCPRRKGTTVILR